MSYIWIISILSLVILFLSTLSIIYIRNTTGNSGSTLYFIIITILTIGAIAWTIYISNDQSWWYLLSLLPSLIVGYFTWEWAGNLKEYEREHNETNILEDPSLNLIIKNRALSIAEKSLSVSFDDQMWQKFGYEKRPAYGDLFQYFREDWIVKLEENLTIEFQLIYAATAIRNNNEISNNEKLVELIVHILTSGTSRRDRWMWKSYSFESKEECVTHFKEGILSYLEKEFDEWKSCLSQRINLNSIPDDNFKSKIINGIAELDIVFKNWAANASQL